MKITLNWLKQYVDFNESPKNDLGGPQGAALEQGQIGEQN